MKREWVIINGIDEIHLMPWHAVDIAKRPPTLPSWSCRVDKLERSDLIDICRELDLSHGDFSRVSTRTLHDQVNHALESGVLIALLVKQRAYGYFSQKKIEKKESAPAEYVQENHWIALKLVDASNQPVADARYSLKLPNGREVSGKLDSMGQTRVDGIPPGTCTVTFPDYGDNWSRV